jgi:3-phosphoshikimate 1-carboxyvinyltransferase
MILRVSPSELAGTVLTPPSKSVTQRLLAASLLAQGTSRIEGLSESDDCTAALGAVAALGGEIELGEDAVEVTGCAGRPRPRSGSVACGESGLGFRLFAPIAALADTPVELTAEGTLRQRPMSTYLESLPALGVQVTATNGRPPVHVHGPLRGGRLRVDGSVSSQFLTGLLTALPCAQGDSEVEVVGLVSRPYVDMTLHILRDFGLTIEADADLSHFRIPGGQIPHPITTAVDGDWSGAAFLLVAGMLTGAPHLEVAGLDNRYVQADEAIRGALLFAGGRTSATDTGLRVDRRPVRPFTVDLTDAPDLFPPLVALAAFADGPSTLRGAGRLLHKETDRAAVLTREFARAGIAIDHAGDALVVTPRPGPDRVLPARLHSHGDHRIAMAAALLGLAGAPIEIEGAEAVAKSYPAFFDDLESVGARIAWVSTAR